MKWMVTGLILLLALWSSAMAGQNGGAAVAVHVMEHDTRTCVKGFPSIQGCYDIVTTVAANDVDCFPVFYWLIEYQGFDYGLSWPGTYSCVFTSCSDLTIGSIVNAGDGVSQAWLTCHKDDPVIPGWAWIYEPGAATISVVAHPVAGAINIGDCSGDLDQPFFEHCAGIGGAQGSSNPCSGLTGTDESTWGSIKGLFRSERPARRPDATQD